MRNRWRLLIAIFSLFLVAQSCFVNDRIYPVSSIAEVQAYARKHGLPKAVIFDIDNTLIESARQISLDPSTNGFLRKQFPDNSEEVIAAIQAQVPWKLCEQTTAEVVKFFQDQNVKIIGVTKRSSTMKETLHTQLKSNGIDLSLSGFGELEVEGGVYYKGVLHAHRDKGTSLKALFRKAGWQWNGHTLYAIDDRRSHLKDFQKQFANEVCLIAFEYTYCHKQSVDEKVLKLQLQDFLSQQEIREDSYYSSEK